MQEGGEAAVSGTLPRARHSNRRKWIPRSGAGDDVAGRSDFCNMGSASAGESCALLRGTLNTRGKGLISLTAVCSCLMHPLLHVRCAAGCLGWLTIGRLGSPSGCWPLQHTFSLPLPSLHWPLASNSLRRQVTSTGHSCSSLLWLCGVHAEPSCLHHKLMPGYWSLPGVTSFLSVLPGCRWHPLRCASPDGDCALWHHSGKPLSVQLQCKPHPRSRAQPLQHADTYQRPLQCMCEEATSSSVAAGNLWGPALAHRRCGRAHCPGEAATGPRKRRTGGSCLSAT